MTTTFAVPLYVAHCHDESVFYQSKMKRLSTIPLDKLFTLPNFARVQPIITRSGHADAARCDVLILGGGQVKQVLRFTGRDLQALREASRTYTGNNIPVKAL